MKKMEKKKKTWLLLAVCFVVLAVAAAVAVSFFAPGADEQPVQAATEPNQLQSGFDGKLYWNVERTLYYGNKNLLRSQADDGTIAMTFAVDGEQVRLRAADRAIANKADSNELMGLVFDSNGVIVDVLPIEECTGGYAVEHFFVEDIQGNEIICNSTANFQGYQKSFILEENAGVYRGGAVDLLVGTPTEVNFNDEVIAVNDKDGKVFCVYVIPYKEPGDVYWNVKRMYDSASGMTTRETDVRGYYIFDVAINGELTTVKTRDMNIATAMDKDAGRHWGLEFDEEGNVCAVISAKNVTGGRFFSSWFHVMEVSENGYHAKKISNGSDKGNEVDGRFSREYKIFDVSGASGPIGTPVDRLKVGDQITALTDSRDQVCTVFIINRKLESEMYWNVERMKNADNSASARIPNAQGEYEILLAVNGQQVTYKCVDKALVDTMDTRADRHFGLKIEDGYITEVYTPYQVTGGTFWASWCRLTDMAEDGTLTALRVDAGSNQGKSYTAPMAPDCKVYNVSDIYDSHVGEETTLRLGDKVHGEMDFQGNLVVIYVVDRSVDSQMYWNVDRQYDSTNKVTKRTPNADGYYELVLAVGGRQITVRTRDKSLVNTMDGRADRHFGLKLAGDIVLKVYTPYQVTGGTFFASWCNVIGVGNEGITALRVDAGSNQGKVYTAPVAPGCEIYDVSGAAMMVGEPTYIRLGDKIHGELDYMGNIVCLYVVGSRVVEGAELHWNVNRMYDSKTGLSTRQPNAEGWYEILTAVNGQQMTVRTQDADIVQQMDAKVDRYFGLVLDGDVITRYVHPDSVTGGSFFASWCDVMDITDGTVTAERTAAGSNQGTVYTAKMAKDCKVYNVSANHWEFSGEETTLKVGDRIQGQKNKKGELVYIYVVDRFSLPEAEHTCQHGGEDQQWYAWNGKSDLSKPGHYVLIQDVTLTAGRKVNAAGSVTLCLNGYTINGTETATALTVYDGADLTICDHKLEDGTYAGNFNTPFTGLSGGVFYIYDGGSVQIRGGNYTHTGTCQMAGIGGVGNKGAGARLAVYDGNFVSDTSTGNGGMFSIYAGAQCEIYGGTFRSTEAKNGGILYMNKNTTLRISGGSFLGGTATAEGGAIYASNADVTISGGHFSGYSAGNGGCIYLKDSQLKLCGDMRIENCSATGNGGAVSVNSSVFTMEDGTLSGCSANEGGNLHLAPGAAKTATISGGLIENGSAKNGGNIVNFGETYFTGGTVRGGRATGNGGNIQAFRGTTGVFTMSGTARFEDGDLYCAGVSSDARYGTIVILGGTVDGNMLAGTQGKIIISAGTVTGKVTVNSAGTLELSQKPQVGEVYLRTGAQITMTSALEETVVVPLSMESPGEFAQALTDKDTERFQAVDNALSVYEIDGKLLLMQANAHLHCLCGGDGTDSHESCALLTWQAWDKTDSLPTTSGCYYLTEDVDLSGLTSSKDTLYDLDVGVRLQLCLNGHTIKAPTAHTLWWVREYLAITDCQEDAQGADKGTILVSNTKSGPLANVFSSKAPGGTLELYGGNVTYVGTGAKDGGLVYMGNSGSNPATFNMYGGRLSGGKATSGGGAIFCHTAVKTYVNLYGGEITGCSANNGGAIYVGNGELKITGGKITDCTATNQGGGIYLLASKAKLWLQGGEISGCSATSMGGGIFADSGVQIPAFENFEMYECFAKDGGGMSVACPVTMTSGTIRDCWATNEGGNVRIGTAGTFSLEGGTVSGGGVNTENQTVAKKGGNFQIFGRLNVKSGTVSGGKSINQGGNIALWGGTVEITGGSVVDGVSNAGGGNICANAASGKKGTVIISAGTLSGGTAPMAPDVLLQSNGVAQLSGKAKTNVYVTTALSVTLGAFEEGAQVILNAGKTLAVAQNVTEDPASYVFADTGFKLTWQDHTLTLEKEETNSLPLQGKA